MGFSFSAPPPPLQNLMTLKEQLRAPVTPPSPSGDSLSPSVLVIAAIIAFVFVASASIHLLLRYLSRQSSSSSSSSGALSPLVHLRRISSSAVTPASPSSPPARRLDGEEEDLIRSLPLFTLASALAALPKSSLDCAVCLSSFHPHDQLRLLPYCRHAFHSTCIDTWLHSSLSCPLCRSPIVRESSGPPPAPSLPPAAASATTPPAEPASGIDRSAGSFRVEMGSVSRRTTQQEGDIPELPPHARSYSLGSSFDYVVEEEVEAVVAAIAARVRRKDVVDKDVPSDAAPPPPGEDVAEAAGWGGGSRSWLRHYVDRFASSASSSFSSLRFSGCSSRRFDGGVVVDATGVGAGDTWDLEGGARPRQVHGDDPEDESAGAVYYSFYKWLLMGA